jgi:hypothetical protein
LFTLWPSPPAEAMASIKRGDPKNLKAMPALRARGHKTYKYIYLEGDKTVLPPRGGDWIKHGISWVIEACVEGTLRLETRWKGKRIKILFLASS